MSGLNEYVGVGLRNFRLDFNMKEHSPFVTSSNVRSRKAHAQVLRGALYSNDRSYFLCRRGELLHRPPPTRPLCSDRSMRILRALRHDLGGQCDSVGGVGV